MPSRKRKTNPVFGSRTDIGCVREQNEDNLIVSPPLYAVCDGMGGHAAGEVASEIAVGVISQRAPALPDANALGQAVEEANLAVLTAAEEGSEHAGMGTTCTAAMIENERLVVAQVGDSRAYLLHQGTLQQITRDHSLVADLVDAGQLTPEEARVHPQRSMITRALGSDPCMKPDLYEINVEAGDRLLLCSDGLYSMVKDSDIEETLRRTTDPQKAADELIDAAIEAGGNDNITAIVVNITGFTEVQHKKVARRGRITAVFIVVLLVVILAAAGFAFSYWTSHVAYLGEQDGKVAIYVGIPGDIAGISFSNLNEVTDVELDDLQPGVANRVKNEEIRTDSLEAAQELVNEYRADIAASKAEATNTTNSSENASTDETNAAAGAADAAGGANAAGAADAAAGNTEGANSGGETNTGDTEVGA